MADGFSPLPVHIGLGARILALAEDGPGPVLFFFNGRLGVFLMVELEDTETVLLPPTLPIPPTSLGLPPNMVIKDEVSSMGEISTALGTVCLCGIIGLSGTDPAASESLC